MGLSRVATGGLTCIDESDSELLEESGSECSDSIGGEETKGLSGSLGATTGGGGENEEGPSTFCRGDSKLISCVWIAGATGAETGGGSVTRGSTSVIASCACGCVFDF